MREVRRVRLDSLHEDPANARHHDERNLAAIRASLTEFKEVADGLVEPLVVQKSTGRIIAGNGRYRVIKDLGWQMADATVLDVDDLTATRLALALNRTAELATWDNAVLNRLLTSLETPAPGWTPEDLQALLEGVRLDQEAGPSVEEYAETYENTSLRQITIVLPASQYKDVLAQFDAIMSARGLDTNAEVVLFLLDHYERTRPPG